jgi:hypothetical protein
MNVKGVVLDVSTMAWPPRLISVEARPAASVYAIHFTDGGGQRHRGDTSLAHRKDLALRRMRIIDS